MGETMNHTTRTQNFQSYLSANQPKGLFFGKPNQAIFSDLCVRNYGKNSSLLDAIHKLENSKLTPDVYMKTYHKSLVNLCVPAEHQAAYYHALQKMNCYPYSRGLDRRTVRTKGYHPHSQIAFTLLWDYYCFGFFKCSISDFCENKLSPEKLDFKNNMYQFFTLPHLDYIIGAAIDLKIGNISQTLQHIIMSDNNTAFVTVPMIRGILKGSDWSLHKLLGEFLLAARLQEGVRQSICENMDSGVDSAFVLLFKVIYDNNLIRYSSVKRAVATWIGIIDLKDTDRIMNKILETMYQCIFVPDTIKRYTESQDAIEIMTGLWRLGSMDVLDAVGVIKAYVKSGTRQQKLVSSYYNRCLDFPTFYNQVSTAMMEAHPTDPEVAAAFFPTYINQSAEVTFPNKVQAIQHFELLKELLFCMTEKKKTYAPFLFPWYSVEITKDDIIGRLCFIAKMLGDNSHLDYMANLYITKQYSNSYHLKLLFAKPASPIQRRCLLEALNGRTQDLRSTAYHILKDLTLTPEDRAYLEGLNSSNFSDARYYALVLLNPSAVNTKKKEVTIPSPSFEEGAFLQPVILEKGLNYPLFSVTKERLDSLFRGLNDLIHEHRQTEIVFPDRDSQLLMNLQYGLPPLTREAVENPEDRIPLFSVWNHFYQAQINNFETLYAMYLSCNPMAILPHLEGGKYWEKHYRQILGNPVIDLDITSYTYGASGYFTNTLIFSVINNLLSVYTDKSVMQEIGNKCVAYIVNSIPKEQITLKVKEAFRRNYPREYASIIMNNTHSMTADSPLITLLNDYQNSFSSFSSVELYKSYFNNLYSLDKLVLSLKNSTKRLTPLDYMKMAFYQLLPLEKMHWYLDHYFTLDQFIRQLNLLKNYKEKNYYFQTLLKKYNLHYFDDSYQPDFYEFCHKLYEELIDKVVSEECNRGDIPTQYSDYVSLIPSALGIERLIKILKALGEEKICRNYSYSEFSSKKVCLSKLLRVTGPKKEETIGDFKGAIADCDFTEQRLIELAMYTPQWLDMLEPYLNIPALKSSVLYFKAHMDDGFSSKDMALISNYTPLSGEALTQGAFDLKWFHEIYEALSPSHFKLLYQAAKYLTVNGKHTRARKYADAALGKLNLEETCKEIEAKRNKDLLMAMALIPIKDKKEVLYRYEFISNFLKASKSFGSQRQLSERKACEMALQNLAASAGYSDVSRLTLSMEVALIQSIASHFDWCPLDSELSVRIEVDSNGAAAIHCEKKGKTLANVPAAYKKNEYVLTLKESLTKLKDQHKRGITMLESAMEERDEFTLAELLNLQVSPVLKPIIGNLIFITTAKETETVSPLSYGLLHKDGLESLKGEITPFPEWTLLKVAHPYDLYALNIWADVQKDFYSMAQNKGIKQPFRQVFRELYVKLEEELLLSSSKQFTGNQIQPKKASACLKQRRWIANYEDGLQKIYYKDDIIVSLYALADWFSPSDIEAPTLESVSFYHRKTYKPLFIKDIPDIVYSEIMRDVDMAVSVAHAGGVDPETSHSTMEMRTVIARCNIDLFGLSNVRLEGRFALIQGSLGEYSIHLGSGSIHKAGGHQINVLPVHSQSRGLIFLPFLDEDPKTAEIISKIILFAQDKKIKDPYILRQL